MHQLLGLGLLAGCAGALLPRTANADQFHHYVNSANTMTMSVHFCDPTTAQHAPVAQCAVEPGFVLTGGGAEVVNDGNPGALLVSSFPDNGMTVWTAKSKDQVYSYPHQLRAYAVGIQLSGVSEATLRANMWCNHGTSPVSDIPYLTYNVPAGYNRIGGGTDVHYQGAGLLLVMSVPSDGWNAGGWTGEAKAQGIEDQGTIDVYAIGIRPTIPVFGALKFSYGLSTDPPPVCGPGYCNAAVYNTDASYIVSSVGAWTDYNGNGRLLTVIDPVVNYGGLPIPGATAQSKDHIYSDTGQLLAEFVVIGKQ
ncbi:MAG TPA: hypothetical protein VHC69_32425 [Polyangiaceae bacterium]|nr:hypothetical protein [Polyangiaceae bacterium]